MNKKIVGRKGEDMACDYLQSNGYEIVERNYLKRYGEIDIVCKKDETTCFIEVKTIVGLWGLQSGMNEHRPEENVHNLKLRKMRRTIETYLWERYKRQEVDLRVHVICVYLDYNLDLGSIKIIENVIL